MRKYTVSGMSCAACSARVERAVSSLEGITSCSVNLLTSTLTVDGEAPYEKIAEAVTAAGYGISEECPSAPSDEKKLSPDTKAVLKRLLYSAALLIPLMYLSMGYAMMGFPLPGFLADNPVWIAVIQKLLCVAVMLINARFFISGTSAAAHLAPNMDTLISLGSLASFVYSVYILIDMASGHAGHAALHSLYFESAAMILTLITLGKLLESYSKGRTTDALASLIKMSPKQATVIKDGREISLPVGELKVGDIFIVRPGESIAADGVVVDGQSTVDESALTGESTPADKACGDKVYSATINKAGALKCRVTSLGEDTAFSKIIKMVTDASASKAPIAKIADKVAGIFVPVVIGIALITTVIWLIVGSGLEYALARGISVLVISCPCSLGLATPVAIMVASGVGARGGILFKSAEALEITGRINTVVLDKTGTITMGTPDVFDVVSCSVEKDELLSIAYSIEYNSEHPLAKAITLYARESGVTLHQVEDFKTLPGFGVYAKLGGCDVYGGSLSFISTVADIDDESKAKAESFANSGKTPLLFTKSGKIAGIISVADKIKPDSANAVSEMKRMNLSVVMMTGDSEAVAKSVGASVGIDQVIAGVLPDGKESAVKDLMQHSSVAMVGDGINDAPALTRADVGIAIAQGTDVAIDSSDIVLLSSSLSDAVSAIKLSRLTLRTIKQNLFWAFFYNTIGIPIAAGVLAPLGILLNPMIAAGAMSLSSIFVVMNALRLNRFKYYKPKTDVRYDKMKKEMKIEGMMCPHCEARVKNTLDAIPGVISANVDHKVGLAVVEISDGVTDGILKDAVTAQGYTVISIE